MNYLPKLLPMLQLAETLGWKRNYHAFVDEDITYRYHKNSVTMAYDHALTEEGMEDIKKRFAAVA